ncbi:nuclear mitotic apparatus protein 1-like isoform X3 [Thrips palmi]|uniref:Nuclear mitotic apparatus protein 1-like isoform X3 n=1 Tax=Thrips palmi TaxID=161013 RepID=A0A6P8Y9I2_THRPL|nr:nuclear mitotic apparatus protein 1-like isoform X3 [Thrips palmi]
MQVSLPHAMWVNARRSSSSSSISPSVSLTDCAVDLSTSVDCNIIRLGLGNLRKHGALDLSLARVHSVGRAADVTSSRVFQPDLINHHLEYQRDDTQSPDEVAKRPQIKNARVSAAEQELVSNGITSKKRPSDSSKPNIPGNSVVLSDFDPGNNLESYQVPVVTTDKLQPYPPGFITIVKEGPAHEVSSSVLLASIEQELEALKSPQHINSSMASNEEIHLDAVDHHGTEIKVCHCRIALEERLHATVKGCLELKHQVELADSKCARWEKEAGESSECVAKLRTKVSELEIELAARNASLHGLKAKVAQQFMENDDINERRRQFERDSKAQLAQLDSIKKSELWYREQLHLTQVERCTLQNQLMSTQEDVVRQAHELERLRSDLKRVQDQLKESEEKSLKEKQNFTMRLEKALAFSTHLPNHENPNKSQKVAEDHAVTELKQRVSDLELSLEASNSNLERSGTEIDRLVSRSLQLQRELSETKMRLQEDQDRLLAATKDRDKAEAALQERERALALLSQEHTTLSVKLECQARERADQDEALQTLTRNFTNVSSRFNAMRAETQRLREEAEARREETRAAQAERDAALARLDDAARREQTHTLTAKLQAEDRDAARGAREAQLEGEVRALREGLDSARGAHQRADNLHAENLQLAGRNDLLQAQVERLSALLQQNTGSGVREQDGAAQQAKVDQMQVEHAQLQVQLRGSGVQVEQLQAENSRLLSQVQKSTARLAELTQSLQVLETEMAELRQQLQVQQGQDGLVAQLRAENSLLQRDKHDLGARVDELSLWLDTMTQGMRLGAEGSTEERLRRLSTSPVHVEAVLDVPEDARGQLEVLRDANSELALHAAALQRKLDAVLDKATAATNGLATDAHATPDLLASSGKDLGKGEDLQTASKKDDVRGLLALLQVCLYRARETHRANGVHDGHGDHVIGEGLGEGADRQELACALDKLAASLEVLGLAHGGRPDALEALEERANRRDDMVRALLGRLKDQVLARKAAEDKLAALGVTNGKGPGLDHGLDHDCHACALNGGAPAAGEFGDSLSVAEHDAEREAERRRLEQEVCDLKANIAELHLQLFNERRDLSQLRKEVSSLRLGLDTANDMLDSNKVALGRSEAYGQVLKVSKEQLELRFEKEQRDHEDCRLRLEQLQEQLQEARAKDPLMESNIKALGYHLHQRSGEVRALQDRLALRDREHDALRVQMERQRAAARRDYEELQKELQQAQREFSEALRKMSSNVPDPVPCDEEGLSALIQESNRLSPAVLDDLKALLHNLKVELKSVERDVGVNIERTAAVVQHV